MGSFPGNCEIVEAKEEINTGKLAGNHEPNSELRQKHLVAKLANKDNLDDDLNKLFESIRLRNSSKDLGLLQDGSSTKMKNALKKPITGGVARSPRIGTSEPLTLKQALRDLCISKASEMAAMKRLSKSTSSPRVSEVGKIKTLYNSVVGEASGSGPPFVEIKGSRTEISLMPEESKSIEKASHSQKFFENKTCSQNIHSSAKIAMATPQNDTRTSEVQSDMVYSSCSVGIQSQRLEPTQTENQSCASSPSFSNTNGSKSQLLDIFPMSKKIGNKAPLLVGSSQTASSLSTSVNGNRVDTLSHNAPHTVKSVIRNKNSSNKKLKQDSGTALRDPTSNEMNNKSVPGQLICERCQCALETANKESSEISIALNSNSHGDGVGSSNVKYGANEPGLTSTSSDRNREITKVEKNARLREQSEFSQSSESSQGDYRSSTSTSDESNVSGTSCGHRPHMSRDFRWEIIRHACRQKGVLDLRHFNLLKKLGCGDIGTVYLAELIGTNCLFAIKVMDNEYLAKRKKMVRAEAEREILRMLDHPFLPTLFAQFASDNLSCLVMEYCPGGDLHVLRQKQLNRRFSEPAARFYVAEVLLALEYLHMIGVVYRDLKPENILVREDGHIMLSDFDLSLRCAVSPMLLKSSDIDLPKISGPCTQSNCIEPFCIEPSCQVPCFSPRFLPATAKARKEKSDLFTHIRSLPQLVAEPTEARSNSFVGTHEYLAPEIIKGEGHGAAVDWWTFSIFLYELLYGRTPFKGSNNEEILVNVVLQSLKFPETPFVSFQAKDLIRGLLVKDPENRLGSEKGAAEIKQHPFFEGINWALVRCAVPPEVREYCDFAVSDTASQGKGKYLEYEATGEQVEIELF